MLDNPNPVVNSSVQKKKFRRPAGNLEAEDIYDLISTIRDPEHPYTLEELSVVSEELINLDQTNKTLDICFTPTVPHCSLSTLIGLMMRVKLMTYIPKSLKVSIRVTPGSHDQEAEINKQLNDKERVAAALENPNLMEVVQSNISDWE